MADESSIDRIMELIRTDSTVNIKAGGIPIQEDVEAMVSVKIVSRFMDFIRVAGRAQAVRMGVEADYDKDLIAAGGVLSDNEIRVAVAVLTWYFKGQEY